MWPICRDGIFKFRDASIAANRLGKSIDRLLAIWFPISVGGVAIAGPSLR